MRSVSNPTSRHRSFSSAWLNDDEKAKHVNLGDARSRSWHEAVQTWPKSAINPRLINALLAQAERWHAPELTKQRISQLSNPEAVAVVTGQQCGFLLGPCYTIYKALTAIEWAARSEAITGRTTIPVFWLQSEDHDYQEIADAHILNGDKLAKVTMTMSGHERTSVAHRVLTREVNEALSQLGRTLHHLPFGREVVMAASDAWSPGRRVVDAFAMTLYQWLGHLGLVILDPRDPHLATLAQPIHDKAIFDAEGIENTLKIQCDRLLDLGFRIQIPARPHATLSFFHPDGPDGPRYRIVRTTEGFELSGRSRKLNASEIRKELNTNPECFSTSALLRPLLQEHLLPTVATVVGPGELSYFSQLPSLFNVFGYRNPGVIPRSKARLWTASWRRSFRKGDFTESDLVDRRDEVLKRIGLSRAHPLADELRTQALEAPLQAIDRFMAEAEDLEHGVIQSAKRTRRTLEKSVSGLLDRYARSTAQKFERHLERLDQLRIALAPNQAPQERILSPLHFAAVFGTQRLVSTLQTALHSDTAGQLTEVELW